VSLQTSNVVLIINVNFPVNTFTEEENVGDGNIEITDKDGHGEKSDVTGEEVIQKGHIVSPSDQGTYIISYFYQLKSFALILALCTLYVFQHC